MKTTSSVLIPNLGHHAHFMHRDLMFNPHPLKKAVRRAVPPTTLPVDNSNGQKCVWKMYDNDRFGNCGPVMMAHVDNTLTYGRGQEGWQESDFDVNKLDSQYEQVSGGDNGTDEDMVVNKIGKVGIAGDPKAIIIDALDFDVTNVTQAQYFLDQFLHTCMAWSVPNDFIQNFQGNGQKFLQPMTPNPDQGHFTPLIDVDAAGNYSIPTWGTYFWSSPEFVASVQPQCFVMFSPRQFSLATGLDCKGRHITTQAQKWQAAGGNPIPIAVINLFPPLNPNGPTPPTPIVPPSPSGIWGQLLLILQQILPAWLYAILAGLTPAQQTEFCRRWLAMRAARIGHYQNRLPANIIPDVLKVLGDIAAIAATTDWSQLIADVKTIIEDITSVPPGN